MKPIIYIFLGAITLIIIFLLFLDIDHILCGELPDELRIKIESVESKYGSLVEISYIPCEPSYINLKIKGLNHNIPYDAIHKILYDENKRLGWAILLVYDSHNKYLFSHSFTNKVYKQLGD